jgi:hypothetical protein
VCSVHNASAQEDSSTTDYFSQEIIVRSPYIFEGTVIRSYNFWLDKQAVGRYTIQLHKSFKGELGNAFVEILAGPDSSGIEDTITHRKIPLMSLDGAQHFHSGQTCTFICNDVRTDKPLSIKLYTPLVQNVCAFEYSLQNTFSANSAAATACISNTCKSFGSISALYRYLRKFDGVHERVIDKKVFEKGK